MGQASLQEKERALNNAVASVEMDKISDTEWLKKNRKLAEENNDESITVQELD